MEVSKSKQIEKKLSKITQNKILNFILFSHETKFLSRFSPRSKNSDTFYNFFLINISVIFASYYFFSRLTTYHTCFSVTVFNNVFKANFLGHSSCKPLSFELELRPYR